MVKLRKAVPLIGKFGLKCEELYSEPGSELVSDGIKERNFVRKVMKLWHKVHKREERDPCEYTFEEPRDFHEEEKTKCVVEKEGEEEEESILDSENESQVDDKDPKTPAKNSK